MKKLAAAGPAHVRLYGNSIVRAGCALARGIRQAGKQAGENSYKERREIRRGQFFGPGQCGESNEPTTTEIYSDEAFFDSNKSMGIFSGRVKVTDPALQSSVRQIDHLHHQRGKPGTGESDRRRQRRGRSRPARSEWRATDARGRPFRHRDLYGGNRRRRVDWNTAGAARIEHAFGHQRRHGHDH